jgi:hypothetical protein
VFDGKPSGMVLVMDFDSADAISGMFKSEDYAALVPVRDKGFAEMNIQLTHEMSIPDLSNHGTKGARQWGFFPRNGISRCGKNRACSESLLESAGYFRAIQLAESGGHSTTEFKRLYEYPTQRLQLGC